MHDLSGHDSLFIRVGRAWVLIPMNNLVVAASLALLCNQQFVLHSNNGDEAVACLKHIMAKRSVQNVAEIDVQSISYEQLVQATSYTEGQHQFNQVTILRNMNKASVEVQRVLLRFLDELAEYDTNRSQMGNNQYVVMDGKRIIKPKFMTLVAVIEVNENEVNDVILKSLKEKFLFSHFYLAQGQKLDDTAVDGYMETLRGVSEAIPKVFQSHEINGYIYSLVVHIRNHRLATLSQLQTRLKSDVMDKVSLLSKAIVAWQFQTQPDRLFVTPEKCKVAMRKIGYWLVAWQDKGGLFDFNKQQSDEVATETTRKTIINMLGGEWYGSEYEYAKQYLIEHQAFYDTLSNTGFSNKLIEDSIKAVRPPI